jgi:uncharacterized membrane-anchored protein
MKPSLRERAEPLAPKVPEITLMFWVIKVLTTGMGESMSDFLGQKSIPIGGAIGVFGFAYAMRLQLRQREYRAPVYWFAVVMVAIFGTMVADVLKDGTGVSYAVTTPIFGALTAYVFYRWYRSEGTLSIHSITTRRRERFYWCAVLATFALGTAAGDLTAISLNLGFFASILLFGAAILVPGVLWWRGKLNPIVAFWSAYVITRPLGASIVDWLGKPVGQTGVGLGDGTVSGLALIVFVALVAYVAVARNDIQRAHAARAHARPAGSRDHGLVTDAA